MWKSIFKFKWVSLILFDAIRYIRNKFNKPE
jgi:hypothetical protein